MNTKIDVSVILVNYKTCQLLCNAIDSVIELTEDVSYEIIVVDNNSQDDSRQIIRSKYGSMVQYLALGENIGFGRANNEGMKVAKGRNFLLLNPDTILINNAIKILSEYLDSHDKVGVVGGNLYNVDGSVQYSYDLSQISLFNKLLILSGIYYLLPSRRKRFNTTEIPLDVSVVVGACFMLKAEIFISTAGFDPRFFMYAEESEWCRRIMKSNHKIVNIPKAKITHLDGGSFKFSEHRQLRRMEGEKIYYKVCFNPFTCRILTLTDRLIAIEKLCICIIIRDKERIELWKFRVKNI